MARPKVEATHTAFPQNTPMSKPIPVISDERRKALGEVCSQLIDSAIANRSGLDQNLDIWNAILEFRSSPINLPWEGASHITSTTVFAAYTEFCSRIIGSVLQPRPYTVRGNDPISSQFAHAIEQFYNAEFDENDCFDAYELAIRFGARDGTMGMEVLYDLSTHEEIMLFDEPALNADGSPQMDANGLPMTTKSKKIVKFIDYDAPRETAIDLKSLLFYPAHATDENQALAVGVRVYLSNQDITARVNADVFDKDAIEFALTYTQPGQGERSMDLQGTSQYTVSGMINVVDTTINAPDDITTAHGDLEFHRLYTRAFDLDNDGVPEENVLYIHRLSRTMVGHMPYDYLGGRPIFPLSMIPRPGLLYGFSVPEIGRSVQEEVDTQTNARLNLLDLAVKPPRFRTQGVRHREGDQHWGPDTEIEMSQKGDYGFIETPQIPQASMVEEQALTEKLDRAVGAPQSPANAQPMGGSQQRSARAASIQAQMQAMNSNLVMTRVRRWMLKIFRFKHGLYLRYGKDQLETVQKSQEGAQRITIPKEVLGLDLTLGITGLGGALDKEGRRQEIAMLTQILLDTPMNVLFQGQTKRLWNLARLNLETYDIPDVTSIIGTLDEADQQQQAMAAAQQTNTMVQALMQVLSHQSANTPKGGAPAPPQGVSAGPSPGQGQAPPMLQA